ncbi:allophycocyanin subunit beta [Synechococcus sp. RSCCF101]|uniref:allophycocyanin subunit beta n=1 Tax=Synechococcus sp. RSCCF101 TaxID=2511069 RepID=UPI0012481BD4|nr:allophycocyanin subunit beta [Synechococcus sp. RSCCF101]QEY31597.1 allophycocyanin subunit beta [Synechococcus sp. RSCCF101]
MRDAVTGLIGRYDLQGRHLDNEAIASVRGYYNQATTRLKAVECINREAAEIVREASQRLFLEDPELLLPGGNAYTTRRLAACLRDMDYFLRYGSYALIAGDPTILNERVLNGLDDTYKSLGVPTGPTVRSMVLMADVLCELLLDEGVPSEDLSIVREPFDHMARGLAQCNLRAR